MTVYTIGTGIAEVTDPAIGLKLQGMADPDQVTQGVESSLYARAFIVADSGKRVAIVSADIWTGTQAVKTEVIRRLRKDYGNTYTDDNVLISGTHTHSGPGGYTGNKLYDDNCGGFDNHNFECIVSGMVTAIENAHKNLKPGKIYINKGMITDDNCGNQRSADAFKNNEEFKKNSGISQTDKEMLLLKFVRLDEAGNPTLPIGTINWYPIHPTDRGQFNLFVSGDNKGEASRLFEEEMGTDYLAKDTFVAAFANSNCGDVSGNVKNENGALKASVPNWDTANGIPIGENLTADQVNMIAHGRVQYENAKDLFSSAQNTVANELLGTVDYRHTRIDISNIEVGKDKRTYPAALGLSFAAGSSEDSVPRMHFIQTFESFHLREGITNDNIEGDEINKKNLTIMGLAAHFDISVNSEEFISGQGQKPIVMAPGLFNIPIVPNILPIQILKIGNLVIIGVPGEPTTMAGRRLKKTILDELKGSGVDHLALTSYANDYSQYITTKEEYEMQHYEGASTLFGPHTLEAYEKKFKELANTLIKGDSAPEAVDSFQDPSSSFVLKRWVTIRNLSDAEKKVEFFKQDDPLILGGIPILAMTKLVPAHEEIIDFVPRDISEMKVRIDGSVLEHVTRERLITIKENGQLELSQYPRYLNKSAPDARRTTIRNESSATHKIEFFKHDDSIMSSTLENGEITINDNTEKPYFVQKGVEKLKIVINGTAQEKTGFVGCLIWIKDDNSITITTYTPPHRKQTHESTIGRNGAIEVNGWLEPVLHIMLSEQPDEVQDQPDEVQDQPDEVQNQPDEVKDQSDAVGPNWMSPVLHMLLSEQSDEMQDQPDEVQNQPDEVKDQSDKVEMNWMSPILHMLLSDQPDEVQDQPDDVQDQPDETQDPLDEMQDRPDEIQDQPDDVQDQPDEVQDQPDEIQDQPDEVQDQPDEVQDQPDTFEPNVGVTHTEEPLTNQEKKDKVKNKKKQQEQREIERREKRRKLIAEQKKRQEQKAREDEEKIRREKEKKKRLEKERKERIEQREKAKQEKKRKLIEEQKKRKEQKKKQNKG